MGINKLHKPKNLFWAEMDEMALLITRRMADSLF